MSDKLRVSRALGIVDPPVPKTEGWRTQKTSFASLWILAAAVSFGICIKLFGPAWSAPIFASASLSHASDAGALCLALVSSVVLHELGHLTAAAALGFNVLAINLGPLRWARSSGQWSFEWRMYGWWTGSVTAVPPLKHKGDEDRWRRDMLLVIAAGPLATLLAAVLPSYLLVVSGPHVSGRTTVAFLAELNAVLFIFGLIPSRRQESVRNDASLISALLTDGRDGREILLYQMLVQLTLQGFRPCHYPEKLIREMAAAQTRPDFSAVFSEAIAHWAWDREDVVTAEAWLERAAAAASFCDERIQSRICSQFACFSLIVYADRTRASVQMENVRTELLSPLWLRYRTSAVSAIISRRSADARHCILQTQALFQKSTPYFEFERKLTSALTLLASV